MTGQAEFGAAVVSHARKYLGVPYVWGGTDPRKGLDCSGLTQLVMRECGVSIPRVTGAQQTVGSRVAGVGAAVPGDLVFFGAPVSGHVGIYTGGNRIIHAPHTGAVVREATIWETPSYIRRVSPGLSVGDRLHGAFGNPLVGGIPGAIYGGLTGKSPIDAAGGAVADAAGGVLHGLDAVGGFFGSLSQRGTWVRVLQVVGGTGLVVAGVVIVGKGVIADVAVSALPGGEVLKAAAGAAK